jgi:hypothetical protein
VFDRRRRIATSIKNATKITVGVGEHGIERDGPPLALGRLIEPSQSPICPAQTIVEAGLGTVERNRLIDEADRESVLVSIIGDHAEKMQSIGMLRLEREDLSAECLRLGQPTGLVFLQSISKDSENASLLFNVTRGVSHALAIAPQLTHRPRKRT